MRLASPLHRPQPARRVWAVRMALAGIVFIAIGVALVLGTLVVSPVRNADVLSAGVTLVVAGAVLRSVSTPVRN